MPISNPSGQPTKDKFFPVTHATAMISGYGVMVRGNCTDLNHYAVCDFHIPEDFASIVAAVLIVMPTSTQAAANWDIKAYYSADGEAAGTHTEEDAASTYNVTNLDLFEVDVSGILSNLAAGDRGGMSLSQGNAAHNVAVIGMRLKYA